MSVWTRITEALSALSKGESLKDVFDRLRTPPERSVAFTIAVIALGAKMAKADGRVTRDEVAAFREVFRIAREDEAGAARVFNMARTDVAGYRDYARRIRRMFENDRDTLGDLMEGLFHIALADGHLHPAEEKMIRSIAATFGLGARDYEEAVSMFGRKTDVNSSYAVLGLAPGATPEEVKKAYRKLAREYHPDVVANKGMGEEFQKFAAEKMRAVNAAYDRIKDAQGF